MRVFLGLALLLVSYIAVPGDLGIDTISQDNKTIFLVKVGAFAQQSDADSYLKKLSTQIKQPISIQRHSDKQLYDNANIELLRQRLYQQTRQRLQNDLFSY